MDLQVQQALLHARLPVVTVCCSGFGVAQANRVLKFVLLPGFVMLKQYLLRTGNLQLVTVVVIQSFGTSFHQVDAREDITMEIGVGTRA